MFSDRRQAGLVLAQELKQFFQDLGQFDKNHIVVLALPRGGVLVALEIALALECSLNIITSKKIGHPDQPELAIGAVTSDGLVVMDQNLINYMNIPLAYLENEKRHLANQTKSLEENWRKLAGLDLSLDVRHKLVIVVDDGVATGMTAIAAARSLRNQGAGQLVFAAPVASYSAYHRLEQEYDQIVVLDIPTDFRSVGQFYYDFQQVQDAEVITALRLGSGKSNQVNV
jgi:predicted phosphoribosyltransferase